jgi:fanconi anemia group M protein
MKKLKGRSMERAAPRLGSALPLCHAPVWSQVLNNDVRRGVCPAAEIVCLVIDECHRVTGNHPTVTAIKEISDTLGASFRILGLSATPGSQPDKIQEVITNLRTRNICFMGDNDPEITPFRHDRVTDVYIVRATEDVAECLRLLSHVLYSQLAKLVEKRAFNHCITERATHYALEQARQAFSAKQSADGCGGNKCAVVQLMWL